MNTKNVRDLKPDDVVVVAKRKTGRPEERRELKSVQLNIKVTPSFRRLLAAMAMERNSSVSGFIEDAIVEMIASRSRDSVQ